MTKRKLKSSYDEHAAGRFWTRRLSSTKPLQAVLGYATPPALNSAYDQWERLSIRRELNAMPGSGKALDLACGTGRITGELLKSGRQVTAVDLAPGMLAHVERRFRPHIKSGNLRLLQASGHRLPFPDRTFSLITCCGLLEHLPDAIRKKTVIEIGRVLTARGKALIMVNNAQSIFLKSRYPMTRQAQNGYFVGLVGWDWLAGLAHQMDRTATIVAANPQYAMIAELSERLAPESLAGEPYEKLCREASRIDLSQGNANPSAQAFASHFLVLLS